MKFISSHKNMGRHKYRKRENEIIQRESLEQSEDIFQSGEGLLDVVKNLTKKGAIKLSQKAGEKAGRKLKDAAFKKTERSAKPEKAKPVQSYEENSGDEIFKILSSASKQKSQKEPKMSEKRTSQRSIQKPPPRSKQMGQQEINERLNMLMNM